MNLTNEQIAIINSKGNIKINAVAGSGKTTTLVEYTKARQVKERILYIAFNKSVKIEAEKKFTAQGITNVKIETAHSLAYNYIVKDSPYKVKKNGVYTTKEIAEILGLRGFNQKHTEFILANHVNKFVAYFCNSNKARVQELNYDDIVFDKQAKKFVNNFKVEILQYSRLFLAKMHNYEIEITHDFYLKKFQQQKPILPFEYILFDEGQDASEAMLDVFLHQDATKIIVGDTHQQIYSWRFAVNSLEKVNYPTYHLSNSFRFDNEIASLANRILKWKNYFCKSEKVIINGYGDFNEVKTKAVLSRTNIALLIKAIELLIEKREVTKIYFEGRFESYTYADEGASIYDVLNLQLGKHHLIKDKLIASMQTMQELEEYIEKTEDAQLALIVEVVEKYGEKLPEYIKIIKEKHLENNDKHNADMTFSTVHRCKGMEYDEVTLTDDFITENKIKNWVDEFGVNKFSISKLSEEINLLYVAVTRTKNKLNIPDVLMPCSKINIVKDTKVNDKKFEPIKNTPYTLEGTRRKNKHVRWTHEEDKKLVELFCEKTQVMDIAKILNRRVSAIRVRAEELELSKTYGTE